MPGHTARARLGDGHRRRRCHRRSRSVHPHPRQCGEARMLIRFTTHALVWIGAVAVATPVRAEEPSVEEVPTEVEAPASPPAPAIPPTAAPVPPTAPEIDERSRLEFDNAVALGRAGSHEEAVAKINLALARRPSWAEAYRLRAGLYAGLSLTYKPGARFLAAQQADLEKYLELNPRADDRPQ